MENNKQIQKEVVVIIQLENLFKGGGVFIQTFQGFTLSNLNIMYFFFYDSSHPCQCQKMSCLVL